jgi:methanogenic corrinoid protein MtbC1
MSQEKGHEELTRLIEEAQVLPPVSAKAAAVFSANKKALVDSVNAAMSARDNLSLLTGGAPMEIMATHHERQADFMANVFILNQFELLVKTFVWLYRSYRAHGFSYDYFPVELRAWVTTIENHLAAEHRAQILGVYRWMIEVHERIALIADQPADDTELDLSLAYNPQFLNALLNADHGEALAMAQEVRNAGDFKSFLIDVIQPSMYEIGRLWENNEISVAQEHLASSIVGRVMTQLYTSIVSVKPTKGRVLITAAPNEFHEIGAWMVSDLLELDGWQVLYLGANTPMDALIETLEDYKPQLLAISVAMPCNLDKVGKIISGIRGKKSLNATTLMVGGRVLRTVPDIWPEIGADATAADARVAVTVARRFCS